MGWPDYKAGLAERALPADTKAVSDAVAEHLSARKRTPEKVPAETSKTPRTNAAVFGIIHLYELK